MIERVADSSPQSSLQQSANGGETGFNPLDGLGFLEATAAKWPERDRLDVLLLRALARLSRRDPAQSERGFSSFELAQMVGELRGKDWPSQIDKERASDEVRKQWIRLLKTWATREEGIFQGFRDRGFAHVPGLDKTEGGGTGRMSMYRVSWLESDAVPFAPLDAAHSPPSNDGAHSLRYVCEDIEDAGWLARVFARDFSLTGWRRWVIVLLVAVPLLVTLAMFIVALLGLIYWEHLGTPVVLEGVVAFLIVLFATWISIGGLLRVVDRRIVVAPWWMQDYEDGRLLEHRNPPRYPSKSIKAVRYTSACPICGGRVVVKSGGLEFWGRVVGRCAHSPVEHLFSFDLVTRSGRHLR